MRRGVVGQEIDNRLTNVRFVHGRGDVILVDRQEGLLWPMDAECKSRTRAAHALVVGGTVVVAIAGTPARRVDDAVGRIQSVVDLQVKRDHARVSGNIGLLDGQRFVDVEAVPKEQDVSIDQLRDSDVATEEHEAKTSDG